RYASQGTVGSGKEWHGPPWHDSNVSIPPERRTKTARILVLIHCCHNQTETLPKNGGRIFDVQKNRLLAHIGAFDPVHFRLLLFPLSIPQLGPGHHGGNEGCACAASEGGSSRSPLATILSTVFGRGRCSLPALLPSSVR